MSRLGSRSACGRCTAEERGAELMPGRPPPKRVRAARRSAAPGGTRSCAERQESGLVRRRRQRGCLARGVRGRAAGSGRPPPGRCASAERGGSPVLQRQPEERADAHERRRVRRRPRAPGAARPPAPRPSLLEPRPAVLALQHAQRRQARRHGHRVAGERAGLVHRSFRARGAASARRRPPKAPTGSPPPMTLPNVARSGVMP